MLNIIKQYSAEGREFYRVYSNHCLGDLIFSYWTDTQVFYYYDGRYRYISQFEFMSVVGFSENSICILLSGLIC